MCYSYWAYFYSNRICYFISRRKVRFKVLLQYSLPTLSTFAYFCLFKKILEVPSISYHYLLIRVFHISVRLMVFPWSLSDSKSPQVSKTLFSILAVLNNVVVWMVSTRPPTSKSSSFFSNPLVTIPNVPITIGIIITCMFKIIIIIPLRVFHTSFS